MSNKFYKSSKEKLVCGILGSIANRYNIDPLILRLPVAVLLVTTSFFNVWSGFDHAASIFIIVYVLVALLTKYDDCK